MTTNNDYITPDEAAQTPDELGTLADYTIDGIEYDTPNLYDSEIEGIEYRDTYYTGEYWRENGMIIYGLEDGNETHRKPVKQ